MRCVSHDEVLAATYMHTHTHTHRLKVKVILERLMRRVSHDEVLAATPEEHHKLIAFIHKRVKRAKNHKVIGIMYVCMHVCMYVETVQELYKLIHSVHT